MKKAKVGIGLSPVDREKMAPVQDRMQNVDYSISQVLTAMAAPMINNMIGGPMAANMKEPLKDLKPDTWPSLALMFSEVFRFIKSHHKNDAISFCI